MLHAISGEARERSQDCGTGGWSVCRGHGGSYAAGRVVERAAGLAIASWGGSSAKPEIDPSLHVAGYDIDTGTLYLESDADDSEAEADLTDDEMIVIRNASGQVVSVTVPFVDSYWARNWPAFLDALARLGGVNVGELARVLGRSGAAAVHSGSYRVGALSNRTPYRVALGTESGLRPAT